uniref:Uncharacterized protein n=1 Tax=Corethron hystrix TaxID=216773 RepID=A0A7S1BZ76_9STRA|mmetsp:Transcript_7647/g.16596  ORF Transcript_7647/g.16596 Transcript_7647/m.16596 type:complete len:320 (+) Transcript_7647:200-1159(+)|eukprot:CAMPEP_0113321466 /NCGR_PEP_ID=MMETSP0010_2-20120614/14942_1 /TAXON_ID=216773 ORGANISM="Corethron hystrix, Strain 308" /NCGR_SAMPLE_ID=MMETSP0010_2 /ASSEMBLY_ACC=CAM_ASM_000155 /LENGTH=319 /DNA_ID=CAMNT_0000179611 /DNA_START=96 /DNA_END=1055 /DNA_ORIENTATION=+ /assembly_acc=CAM_ASM_000155
MANSDLVRGVKIEPHIGSNAFLNEVRIRATLVENIPTQLSAVQGRILDGDSLEVEIKNDVSLTGNENSSQKTFVTLLLIFLALGVVLTIWMFYRWKQGGECIDSAGIEFDNGLPDQEQAVVDREEDDGAHERPRNNPEDGGRSLFSLRSTSMPNLTASQRMKMRNRPHSFAQDNRQHLDKMQRMYLQRRILAGKEHKFTRLWNEGIFKKSKSRGNRSEAEGGNDPEELPSISEDRQAEVPVAGRRILKVTNSSRWNSNILKSKDSADETKDVGHDEGWDRDVLPASSPSSTTSKDELHEMLKQLDGPCTSGNDNGSELL